MEIDFDPALYSSNLTIIERPARQTKTTIIPFKNEMPVLRQRSSGEMTVVTLSWHVLERVGTTIAKWAIDRDAGVFPSEGPPNALSARSVYAE